MEITEEMLYKYAPTAEKLWLGSLPPDDQIPEHQFSQRFERKMNVYKTSIRIHMIFSFLAMIGDLAIPLQRPVLRLPLIKITMK